jgi:valyl-tRNA synthetase
LLASPAGNDLPFDESQCEQGRNFSNKIWNAFRLIKGWQVDDSIPQPQSSKVSVDWFNATLNSTLLELNDHFEKYRMSDAILCIYKLIWDDFCSWYLEMIKPAYQQPIDRATFEATLDIFEKLMQILHPFMPFITEELWHHIRERKDGESVMMTEMPKAGTFDKDFLARFAYAQEVITEIRTVRKEKNISFKDPIKLMIRKNNNEASDTTFDSVAKKLCNISDMGYVTEKVEQAIGFLIRSTEFYIPVEGNIDSEAEILKLKEELKYQQGFIDSVMKKLDNERFVSSAPQQVVDIERKKLADAQSKINIIEEQIRSLKQ